MLNQDPLLLRLTPNSLSQEALLAEHVRAWSCDFLITTNLHAQAAFVRLRGDSCGLGMCQRYAIQPSPCRILLAEGFEIARG